MSKISRRLLLCCLSVRAFSKLHSSYFLKSEKAIKATQPKYNYNKIEKFKLKSIIKTFLMIRNEIFLYLFITEFS